MPGWLRSPELTACQLKLPKDLPLTLSLSWDVALALDKTPAHAIAVDMHGTIGLQVPTLHHVLAIHGRTVRRIVE